MILLANDMDITLPNLIGPVILLVGFCISVAIGVWFAVTKWREHQAQTLCKSCGADLGTTPDRCAVCGALQN